MLTLSNKSRPRSLSAYSAVRRRRLMMTQVFWRLAPFMALVLFLLSA